MMPRFRSAFTADVKVGDVLICPAQTKNRSPVDRSTDRKTIIAIDFTIGDEAVASAVGQQINSKVLSKSINHGWDLQFLDCAYNQYN